MKRHYTDKEIKEKFKNMVCIIDSREQVNEHIVGYLDSKGISHISRKLDSGDYSFQLDDMTFEDEIVIEKKNSIDEIAGNMTADRQRFENEFLRCKSNGTKIFLLVENCSWQQIKAHDYRSKMEPKALIASLLCWQVRYNITIIFCQPEQTGEMIYGILYYWLKEKLS